MRERNAAGERPAEMSTIGDGELSLLGLAGAKKCLGAWLAGENE